MRAGSKASLRGDRERRRERRKKRRKNGRSGKRVLSGKSCGKGN